MELYVNSLLSWNTTSEELEVERVLWISPERERIALIRIDGQKAMPRMFMWSDLRHAHETGAVRILSEDPHADLPENDSDLPESHRTRRDEAWCLIEPIVRLGGEAQFDPQKRGEVIREVVVHHKVSKTTVYHLLRRFWQRGQTRNALLPDYKNCGAAGKERSFGASKRGRPRKVTLQTGVPTGINIGAEERRNLELGIKAFYENRSKPRTLRESYQLTLEKFFSDRIERRNGIPVPILPAAEELPSFDQFRYWYEKTRDVTKALLSRHGERQYNLRNRALGGDAAAAAMGPGSIYQIDSTPLDVNLVSSVDRSRIIARPTLYLVVDVFSRLICGFSIGREKASYVAASLALENAMQDKVQFCAGHGFEITSEQWPAHHVPEMLVADRGELVGKQADNLATLLGITVSNTPPYRADLKPFVERMFRTLNDYLVHNLPGAVPRPKQRGERDTRLDASLNIDELRRLLIITILHYNRSRIEKFRPQTFLIADNVESRPINLWSWGVENRSGHLHSVSSDFVRLALLPGKKASVTPGGIRFGNLFYTCEKALEEQWYVQARERGARQVDIAFDPRNASFIYLRLREAKNPMLCRLLPAYKSFEGLTWDEVEDCFAALHVQKEKSRTDDIQEEAVFNANVNAIVNKARGKTKATLEIEQPSKAARLNNIRDNIIAEDAFVRKREREAREQNAERELANIDASAMPKITGGLNGYVSPPDDFDLLRQERNEHWSES